MPHKFKDSDQDDGLQGVWYKHNGRRFCTWHFNPTSSTLRARRGATVRSTQVQLEADSAELKARLPQLALELSRGGTVH